MSEIYSVATTELLCKGVVAGLRSILALPQAQATGENDRSIWRIYGKMRQIQQTQNLR